MVMVVNGYVLDFTDCSNNGVVRVGDEIFFEGTWNECEVYAETH